MFQKSYKRLFATFKRLFATFKNTMSYPSAYNNIKARNAHPNAAKGF